MEDVRYFGSAELSERIQESDESHYFPLGTMDVMKAEAKAANIRRTISEKGWAAARMIFPREFTLAFFWTASPLTCTYTTLYSAPGQIPERWRQYPMPNQKSCRVIIVEREESVRKAVAFWVRRQPGFACVAELGSVSHALDAAHLDGAEVRFLSRRG